MSASLNRGFIGSANEEEPAENPFLSLGIGCVVPPPSFLISEQSEQRIPKRSCILYLSGWVLSGSNKSDTGGTKPHNY